jgi:hypothetical protein
MNWSISAIWRNCRRLGSARAGRLAIRGEPCRNQPARVHDGHILPGPRAMLKGRHGHGPDALAGPDRISVSDDVTSPGLLASLENQNETGAAVIRPDSPARAISLSGRGRLLPERSGSNVLLLAVLFCVLSAIGRGTAFPGRPERETSTFQEPVSPEMSNAISPEAPTAKCPRVE